MSSVLSSPKYSYLFLRLGLAAVFLWFGIDKFIHPSYWQTAWSSPELLSFAGGIDLAKIIYAAGVFEILTGLSLVFAVFAKFFSALAILYLVVILVVNGLTEITIRDLGLIGGFLAVLLWPNFRRY